MTAFSRSRHAPLTIGRAGLALAALGLGLSACAAPGPSRAPPGVARASSLATAPDPRRQNDSDARFAAALAMMKQGKTVEAQAAFAALSRDYPALSGPLTDLGILYAQGRESGRALASFEQAVRANPRNAVALNWLGTLYRSSGAAVRAEEAYRRAIAVQADYAGAYLNLAILYDTVLNRPQDALVAYRNYQRHAREERLIVEAWIRQLQARLPASSVVAAGEVR